MTSTTTHGAHGARGTVLSPEAQALLGGLRAKLVKLAEAEGLIRAVPIERGHLAGALYSVDRPARELAASGYLNRVPASSWSLFSHVYTLTSPAPDCVTLDLPTATRRRTR